MITKLCKGKKPCETKTDSQCQSFPEKELRTWLKTRTYWNHEDWLGLLDDLRKKGYSAFTDHEDGRAQIGQFLESERKK